MRRVCVLLSLALLACKPTVTKDPEPAPQPASEAASEAANDPLIEQEAVRDAVRAYDAALAQRDADAAVELVVAETFGVYEDLRVTALLATREELEAAHILSVIMALQTRSALTRAELEALDGQSLFHFSVHEGLVGDDEPFNLDEIWVDPDGALAQVRMQGQPVVWLRKTASEADAQLRWRVDVPQMIQQVGPLIEGAVREQVLATGKVRTAYALLELGTDEFVDLQILDGPLEARGEAASAP